MAMAVLDGRLAANREGSGDARRIAAQRLRSASINAVRAAISENGRVVAFVSGPPEGPQRRCCHNVFSLDLVSGAIAQESVSSSGIPDGESQSPSLSADGRIIAFETIASNLIPGDSRRGQRRVVVRHRDDGRLHAPGLENGQEPDGESSQPVVSGSGRVVVFTSDATNLVPGADANGRQTDIYLWTIDNGSVARISVDTNGVQPAGGASHSPAVSRDGDLVAFVSAARLAPEDSNNVADVYLRDVRRGVTSLVSRGIGGRPPDGVSHSPAVSADGRHVAFVSDAANLAPQDRNQSSDVFLLDVATRHIELVSATSAGKSGNAASGRPAVSVDGRFVVYQSVASDLSGPRCPGATSDTNLLPDIYLLDRTTRCVTRISDSRGMEWWTPSVSPAIDGTGTIVVFSSTQPAGQHDEGVDFDLFLFRR